MPGLSAVALDARHSNAVLTAMLDRMAHYPWLRRVDRTTNERVSLGVVTLDHLASTAIATSDDGAAVGVLHGEFFNRAEEPGRAGASGDLSDAELLLRGWQREGPTFLARLDGEFAAAIWDSRGNLLHIITDRFGLRPLYVAHAQSSFAASSEIASVLALPGVDTSLSDAGAAQFFSFGYFFNDNTFLKGVRAVPAATVGTYDLTADHYSETTYWQFRPRPVTGSPAELSAVFEERFVEGVKQRARTGERLGLSLSGGLDARAILGVMPHGVDLQTVSLGIEGSLDHQSAAKLAAIAGVPHHPYMLDASFLSSFEQHLRQMVRLTNGHYLDQGIVMPTMEIYRRLGIDYLMRGHGGELLHMKKAYAFSLDENVVRLSESELDGWLLSHLTDYMLSGVPDDLFTIDLRAEAEASLRRASARCVTTDRPADRIWQLFLNERIHRETSMSMHLFGNFATIRQPYFDNDVIDVLLSMPPEMKLGDDLQTTLLRRRRPAFLGVTNANTGARLGAGPLATEVSRLRMRVFAKLGVKGYQPYERLGLWLRRELRPMVERLLLGDAFLAQSLFRPDAVRRVVGDHMEERANHTFLIMSLVIYQLGQELLNDEKAFSALPTS